MQKHGEMEISTEKKRNDVQLQEDGICVCNSEDARSRGEDGTGIKHFVSIVQSRGGCRKEVKRGLNNCGGVMGEECLELSVIEE